LRPSRDMTT